MASQPELQREVEVVADPPRRGEAAAEVLRRHRGLERAEAQPQLRRGLGYGHDGVREIGAARQVLAVGGYLDAREHQLAVALGGQLPGLLRGALRRQGAHAPPCVWYDAVGAEVLAAVL